MVPRHGRRTPVGAVWPDRGAQGAGGTGPDPLVDGDRALTPRSRATLIDMMRRCVTGSNRIRGMLPYGAVVEHKTGTLNRYTTDVGFLTLPDGRRLAVAFFARGGENRPAVIATAARAIYDGFRPQLAAATPAPGTVQDTGRALLSAGY